MAKKQKTKKTIYIQTLNKYDQTKGISCGEGCYFLTIYILSCLDRVQTEIFKIRVLCICISLLIKWSLGYELHMKRCDSWINSEPTAERRKISMLFE